MANFIRSLIWFDHSHIEIDEWRKITDEIYGKE